MIYMIKKSFLSQQNDIEDNFYYSKAMLKKFGTANCEAVVQRLAEVDNKKLTRDELKEKFEFVKECKVWIPFNTCPLRFHRFKLNT